MLARLSTARLEKEEGDLMKVRLSLVVGVLAIALGVTPSIAMAGGCASKKEFKKVEKGMTTHRVAQIFDTNGKLSFQSGNYMSREYKGCMRYSFVSVSYKSGRVYNKTGSF